MKLSEMNKTEILEIAEEFGTDATEDLNEAQIIARLVEDGVTQEMVDTFLDGKAARIEALEKAEAEAAAAAAAEEAAVITSAAVTGKGRGRAKAAVAAPVAKVEVPDQVLIYMDRENPTYKIRGYTFTKDHPFALVREADAEYIVEHEEGFSYATPKQAREFYS